MPLETLHEQLKAAFEEQNIAWQAYRTYTGNDEAELDALRKSWIAADAKCAAISMQIAAKI